MYPMWADTYLMFAGCLKHLPRREDIMTDKTEPTIEELQKQILDLKKTNEENAVKIQELESDNAKNASDLKESRSLNARLMKQLPVGGEATNDSGEEHQETPDEFFDSFIEPAIKNLGKR